MCTELIQPYNDDGYDNKAECDIVAVSENLLAELRTELPSKKTMSVPIAQLSLLGAGVQSLIPALNTITQSSEIEVPGGLYRLLNDSGSGLKQSKGGFFWGATKESKIGKFSQVDSVTQTVKTTMPIDPTKMMMAVALASIEKQLDDIQETQRQILLFLETEKESEIEADVETLVSVINKYKFNWDNEHFVRSNHKLILDIQRTARKNMISYQKMVADILNSNQFLIAQSAVKSTLNDLLKKFKYYRLSLYSYAMASFLEIMLSKNFKEEYITEIQSEIEKQSFNYRELYDKCSVHLEKMTSSSIETNVMKGIGNASRAFGGFLGGISIFKGSVDSFLKNSGDSLTKNANEIEAGTIAQFKEVSTPNTKVFIDKMDDMIQIYNHTEVIYFDQNLIYLVAG